VTSITQSEGCNKPVNNGSKL